MDSLRSLVEYISNSPFWGPLIVGLIILMIGSIWLPRFIKLLTRPNRLDFFFKETGGKKIYFSQRNADEKYETTFNLVIDNQSDVSFKNKIYWHLYIPADVEVQFHDLYGDRVPRFETLGTHYRFYGQIKEVIFAKTTQELHYEFTIISSSSNIKLMYFFSTEFGRYPKNLKEVKKGSGIFTPGTMAKLYINTK